MLTRGGLPHQLFDLNGRYREEHPAPGGHDQPLAMLNRLPLSCHSRRGVHSSDAGLREARELGHFLTHHGRVQASVHSAAAVGQSGTGAHWGAGQQRPFELCGKLIWNDLSSSGNQSRWRFLGQAQADSSRGSSCRRLITLIFVDRVQGLAIMVVIRRELPRTNGAGPAITACRIAYREDSPLPRACPAADHLRLNRVHKLIWLTSCRVLECTAWGL